MNKSKTTILRARLSPHHVERVEAIGQITGLNISQIMRQLIENAEVTPAKVSAQLYRNVEGGETNKRFCV